jgi:hypothetical protein
VEKWKSGKVKSGKVKSGKVKSVGAKGVCVFFLREGPHKSGAENGLLKKTTGEKERRRNAEADSNRQW